MCSPGRMAGPGCASENGPVLFRPFRRQADELLGGRSPGDPRSDVGPDGRSELEPVPRTAPGEPHVVVVRMTIEQKVAARRVGVLADPGFQHRRIAQCRQPDGGETARSRQPLGRRRTVAAIRVEGRAERGEPDLGAAAFDVGKAVGPGVKVDPRGQGRRREAPVPGGRPEEEDLLACRAQQRSEQVGEQLRQPGTASEDEGPRPTDGCCRSDTRLHRARRGRVAEPPPYGSRRLGRLPAPPPR